MLHLLHWTTNWWMLLAKGVYVCLLTAERTLAMHRSWNCVILLAHHCRLQFSYFYHFPDELDELNRLVGRFPPFLLDPEGLLVQKVCILFLTQSTAIQYSSWPPAGREIEQLSCCLNVYVGFVLFSYCLKIIFLSMVKCYLLQNHCLLILSLLEWVVESWKM